MPPTNVFAGGFLSGGSKDVARNGAPGSHQNDLYNSFITSYGMTPEQASAAAKAQAATDAANDAASAAVDPAATQDYFASPQGQVAEAQIMGNYGANPTAAAASRASIPQLQQNLDTYNQNNATNARYGSDLSWLDPSFQQTPQMLGQSAASQFKANPNIVAAQGDAMNQYGQLAGTPMKFGSDAQQQAAYGQWGAIAGGAGAPQFMGNGGQQAVSSAIGGIAAPQFASAAQQQGIEAQMQARASGQGAPQFASDGQAQAQYAALASRAGGAGAPQFMDGSQQQSVTDKLGSIAASGGSQGLSLDNGSNQAEQLGNMKEIIAGGGDTAIEAARRQSERADQEQWLRSQREADQQSYAQRGLTGSGQELLTLGADRQAAAGRNSLADLDTASALEQRRDATINSAAGLSGTMRDQTNAAQEYQANRGDAALTNQGNELNTMRGQDFTNKSYLDQTSLQATQAAAAQANALRSQDFTNKSYLDQSAQASLANAGQMSNQLRSDQAGEQEFDANNSLAKLNAQASLANQMRGDTYNELTYNDTRATNALSQQTGLANTMRSTADSESIAQRQAQLDALGGYSNQANNLRASSDQNQQYAESAADQFATLNQAAFNTAAAGNASFLQNSYGQMMQNRQNWQSNLLNQGINVAQTQQGFDAGQNTSAYESGANMANGNSGTYNNAQSNYNAQLNAVNTGTSAQVLQAQNAVNTALYPALGQASGKFVDTVAQAAAGGAGEGAGGAAGMSGGTGAAVNVAAGQSQGQDPYKLGINAGMNGNYA